MGRLLLSLMRTAYIVVYHTTVLRDEVMQVAASASRLSLCIDATLGDGGHSLALLERWRRVKVVGVDCDKGMLHRASERLQRYRRRISFVHDHYDSYLADYRGRRAQFVLFDLGLSMAHFTDSGRGFSFAVDEPLDMRLDATQTVRAADIVNRASEDELVRIFREYSQERYARPIAVAIVAERRRDKIVSTAQLARLVSAAMSKGGGRGGRARNSARQHGSGGRSSGAGARAPIHPATRVFQALRIAVNDELARLPRALTGAIGAVGRGGVVASISFHSGEDRIAKQCFRDFAHDSTVELLHKGVVTPQFDEVRSNRAARSAKLRAVRKL